MSAPKHNDLSPDAIRSALDAIDPNVSREEWWRVAAALKSELGDAAFPMFDSWSKRGDNYNARDCADTPRRDDRPRTN